MDSWQTLMDALPRSEFVTFDIETAPLDTALEAPYPADERQPPASYKSAEAIAAWRQRDELAWRAALQKDAALSPRTGRIVAVGAAAMGNDSGTASALSCPDERALILAAREVLQSHALVTFNGLNFDLPFVLTRAAVHGVSMRVVRPKELLRRYVTAPHCDLRMVLGGWDSRAKGTLADWLAAFSLPAKTGSGADVAALWDAQDDDALARYCADDAQRTAWLFRAVREAFDL